MNPEWKAKIVSKVPPSQFHGSVYSGPNAYQDADYAAVVAANIERRKARAKAEREAAA